MILTRDAVTGPAHDRRDQTVSPWWVGLVALRPRDRECSGNNLDPQTPSAGGEGHSPSRDRHPLVRLDPHDPLAAALWELVQAVVRWMSPWHGCWAVGYHTWCGWSTRERCRYCGRGVYEHR